MPDSPFETLAQVFSCEFYEIFQNTFFTEHLWETASASWLIVFWAFLKNFEESFFMNTYGQLFSIIHLQIFSVNIILYNVI